MARTIAKKRCNPLLFAGLCARNKERAERTAQGHGRECLSVAFHRKQQRGHAARDDDESAKRVILKVVFHKRGSRLDAREASYCNTDVAQTLLSERLSR